MRKALKKGVAFSMASLMMLSSAPVFAEAQFHEVKKTQSESTVETSSLSERVSEILGNQKISKMAEGEAYIPAGVELRVEVPEELSSKRNKKGSTLKFILVDNLIINDVIVIPAGTTVMGHVSDQRSSGLFGRSGKLEISVDSVRTLNNVEVPLEYIGRIEAGSDGGAVAVATAISLVGGLFMKGKNVTIPAGTQLKARVKGDVDLGIKVDELADIMNPDKPHGVSVTLK